MESVERVQFEFLLGGIDTSFAKAELGEMKQEVARLQSQLTKQTGGVILGEYLPEMVTEAELKKYQETGGDIITLKETEDAIFRGMWIEAGLTQGDMMTFGGGESTPVQRALEEKLITKAQAAKLEEPLLTKEEMIRIIEQGPVIQMFATETLLTLDIEEHILGNYLIEAGRPDLLDHLITLEDDEHAEISAALGQGEWMRGALSAESPLRSVGGKVEEVLNALKEEGEGERDIEEREQEGYGCIGGIIDKKTCGYCKAQIGTCGLLSELPVPPFHDNCRCEIYRQ